MRKTFTLLAAALALFALPAGVARAQGREAATVAAAVEVIEQATKVEKGIPVKLLCDAKAVAIIPNTVKAGFILGGRRGRGVVMVRCRDSSWSCPIFVTLTGGSVGLQGGVQSTDLVLVFKTGRGVERILKGRGKLTLGADAAVAAGPVGRQAAAATDAQLKAEIFSYSRSRGLFGGVSLDGDALRIDWRGNDGYYSRRGVTPADIVTGNGILIPEPAMRLRAVLTAITAPPGPPLPVLEFPRP